MYQYNKHFGWLGAAILVASVIVAVAALLGSLSYAVTYVMGTAAVLGGAIIFSRRLLSRSYFRAIGWRIVYYREIGITRKDSFIAAQESLNFRLRGLAYKLREIRRTQRHRSEELRTAAVSGSRDSIIAARAALRGAQSYCRSSYREFAILMDAGFFAGLSVFVSDNSYTYPELVDNFLDPNSGEYSYSGRRISIDECDKWLCDERKRRRQIVDREATPNGR